MANRSYIYGVKNNRNISMGEYPYAIPCAFKILAAFDNVVSDSILYEPKVGIRANFEKGKEALYFLLDFLKASKQMDEHEEFENFVVITKEFLDKIDATDIVLESGEIYSLYTDKEGNYLSKEGLEEVNIYESKDYTFMSKELTTLRGMKVLPTQFFRIQDEKFKEVFSWILKLQKSWKKELALDCWSDILYYQFNYKD